jgi:hypothetical protein
LAVWVFGDEEWIDLPGPAEWWQDTYDFDKYGFALHAFEPGYEEAWAMTRLLVTNPIPVERFNMVFPSEDELRVMPDTFEGRAIRDMHGKLAGF